MEMTEATPQKTFKQVCTCQNCGNEAEMIVTCSLEPVEEAPKAQVASGNEPQSEKHQIPGQATCTHCGNEAEILVDMG
jgi:DNA-directed RNA polymerase subunit M/transcription elongation factor TFIIS